MDAFKKNFKFVLKLIFIYILPVCCMVALSIVYAEPTDSYAEQDYRFIRIYKDGSLIIYYDKETNVEYAIRDNGHGGTSMTLLVDAEGKPLLYEKEASDDK